MIVTTSPGSHFEYSASGLGQERIKGKVEMKSPFGLVKLEKRKHPRFAVDLPVEYWKTYNPLSQSSRLVNISEGGVLIHLSEPVEIGQNLKLKISTDARHDFIETLVQVIWKDTDLSNQEGYRIGAKFLGVSPEDMAKLKDFLISLINSAPPSSKILSKIGSILPGLSSPDRREILKRKVQR